MHFKLMIAGLAVILLGNFLQAEWTLQHSGGNVLWDMSFPLGNVDTGFACGANSFVLKTEDGGVNWEQLTIGQPSGNCNAIIFPVNASFGLIACDTGYIQRTTDGHTWRRFPSGITNHLNAIHFPKNVRDTGFVAGMSGKILRTSDAGVSWFDVSPTTSTNFYGAYFVNTQRGRVIGDNGTVYRTLNSGLTWERETTDVSARLLGIYSRDTTFCWIVGANKTFIKTTDRGWNWNPIDLPVPANTDLYSVYFSSDMTTGWVCGTGGQIVKTTNSGTTWHVITVEPANDLYRLIFPLDNLKGWMCGTGEAIYYTTDGGASINEIKPEDKTFSPVFTCSPNPFRSNTTIKYNSSLTSRATLKIYDCSGGLVRNLKFDERGIAKWDGRNELQKRVKSGVYLIELNHNGISQHQKLIVL